MLVVGGDDDEVETTEGQQSWMMRARDRIQPHVLKGCQNHYFN